MASDSPFRVPGRILAGTIVCPDFATSRGDYVHEFGLVTIEEGAVPPDLALGWGAPAQAGRAYALLAAPGGAGGLVRLVEGTPVAAYRPLRHHGWAAFELTVEDAFALRAGLDTRAFAVLGEPRLVPGFDNFIPFQVQGRAGEVLYLNRVLKGSMAGLDLPHATARVDHIFIAVLAAPDRAAAVRFHVDQLAFEEGETWTIPYSMINDSFGLAADTLTAMTMTKTGRIPASEIDQYPPAATVRPAASGELPPGNALVTFGVRDLDAIRAPFLAPPVRRPGPLYMGARAATVVGPAGEAIELVEVGAARTTQPFKPPVDRDAAAANTDIRKGDAPMGIKEDMPLLARHEGVWDGNYRYYDAGGKLVDEHRSRLFCRFPDEGPYPYHQTNHYSWPDGRTEVREFPAEYRDRRIWWNNELIEGWAAELPLDDKGRSVVLYWQRTGDPDLYLYEMIQLSDDGTKRCRTWHWIRNGELETRTAIEERLVSRDWRAIEADTKAAAA